MSATGLDVFDKTLQLTNSWLKRIMEDLGPDRQVAYHALRAVLHTVRDRLTPEQSAHLASQLPMLVRGIYFEGYNPAHQPTKERTEEAFLETIGGKLGGTRPINVRDATRSVLGVLRDELDPNEYGHVKHAMPGSVQGLWP